MSETDEQQYGVSRLVAFSDGVFGFAITLLITTIPFSLEGLSPSASNQQMVQQLLSLLPNFYAYAFSFYMVGLYWVIHHRTFRHITKYDGSLLWINLTLLLFIVFLPVPTSFLGRYGANAVITALYGATQTLIILIYQFMEWYVSSHRRLISPSLNQKAMTSAHLRGLISCAIFALSIGVAFLNPSLAQLCWIAVLVVRPITSSQTKRKEP
jgi:TMEM175 potassium channel family protein